MDLTIHGTLDEVTAICYRIGEPNFQELVEENRKFGVVEYLVNHGLNLDQAIESYDESLKEKKVEVALKNDLKNKETDQEADKVISDLLEDEPEKKTTTQVKKKTKKEDTELHLDGPPPSQITFPELQRLSGKFIEPDKRQLLIDYLNKHHWESLFEIDEKSYPKVYEDLKKLIGE